MKVDYFTQQENLISTSEHLNVKNVSLNFLFYLLIFGSIAAIYSLNSPSFLESDNTPTCYLPVSIIKEGNFDFNEFPFLYDDGYHWYLRKNKEKLYSFFPIGILLPILPVYLIADISGLDLMDNIAILEKISSTLITALSAVFLLAALRRRYSMTVSIISVFIYAFATSNWAINSQRLFQHSTLLLCNNIVIYYLLNGRKLSPGILGFFLSYSIFVREINIIFYLIILLYIALNNRQGILKYILFSMPWFCVFSIYYVLTFNESNIMGFG